MQKKLFGTDGVRGVWREDISPELAYEIGKAVSIVFERENEKNLIVVGKDTRLSSDTILSALVSGMTAMGTNVIILDVVPTACVPFSIFYHKANAGIMITASHNPAEHNGIKFFNGNGFKISEEQESHIEYIIRNSCDYALCKFNRLGKIEHSRKSLKEYINFLKHELPSNKNIKICFDTANGCASEVVKEVFKNFDSAIYNDKPDGLNTNLACGANNISALQSYMQNADFDIGFSFDGDSDRVAVCLKGGQVLSGEEVIYHLAKYNQEKKIATTKMSNMALFNLLKKEGVESIITEIGEKPILSTLLENNLNLGGENNGHYILINKTTTSDGILAATQMLAEFAKNNCLKSAYTPFYQVQRNLLVGDKYEAINSNALQRKIDICESLLMENGRILVRPSGTENLVRVLVEGKNKHLVDEILESICQEVK